MGTAKSFPDSRGCIKREMFLKKMISMMLVIGMMLCFGGCGDAASGLKADIYDKDERLANYYSDYEMSGYTQQIFEDKISGTYQDFNGMAALWIYEDDGGFPIDVKYRLQVSAGKVKLILYHTDGSISTVDTIEEFGENYVADKPKTTTIMLKKGLSCIKLVGTDCVDVTFEIEIKNGSFIGIEP